MSGEAAATRGRFVAVLLLVALAALAVRVGYVLVAKRGEDPAGDQIYYNAQANTLARGHGFTDFRDGTATAEHPPLTALVLTPTSWLVQRLDRSGNAVLAHRLTMALIGTGVVVLIGFVGRTVAGDRAGWLAAGVAALSPNLWVNDGAIMSETLAALAVALAILLAYRFARSPSWERAAGLGAACGLAMLVRAELGLLLPFMVLPVALLLRGEGVGRRLALAGISVLVAAVVVSPWVVRNLVRFEDPVLFSTNDGLTICGANTDHVYYGDGVGLWALDCAFLDPPPGDRSVVSSFLRRRGLDYVRDHTRRVPVVVVARVARTWSLYAPGAMADYNADEGREPVVSWLGFAAFWVLVPLAAWGAVLLRRRRVPLTPLLAQVVVVTVTSMLIYGLVRFRVPAEVSLVVLAAVALDALLPRAAPEAPGRSGPGSEDAGSVRR